jgi:hypothetical protein
MRPVNLIVFTVIGAAAAATVSACRSSSADHAPDSAGVAAIQSLGLPRAANATPVLAVSGHWVVAVWTATEANGTNVYAATSDDAGGRFGPPVRVNDVASEAHVYGEHPPRAAIVPSTDASIAPEIVVTWPSDRATHLGLRSARSLDGGRTFLASMSIGDEHVVGERGFQSVTVGQDRIARAAWLDQRRDPGTPAHKNVEGRLGSDAPDVRIHLARRTVVARDAARDECVRLLQDRGRRRPRRRDLRRVPQHLSWQPARYLVHGVTRQWPDVRANGARQRRPLDAGRLPG